MSFDRAIAQLTPVLFPQLLYSLNAQASREFPAFAAKIEPTEFAPGVVRGSGTMTARRVDAALGRRPGADTAESQPAHRGRRGVGRPADVPLPHGAVPRAAGAGLARPRRDRDARRFPDAERALEVLGRRSARGLQELGGGEATCGTRPARRRASPRWSSSASCSTASS